MVAGIVFIALGTKRTLAHVDNPLEVIPAVALCGGAAFCLLGPNAFRLRDVGNISVPRLVVTVTFCVVISVAMLVPALVTLAILAILLAALAAFETVHSREFRDRLRAH